MDDHTGTLERKSTGHMLDYKDDFYEDISYQRDGISLISRFQKLSYENQEKLNNDEEVKVMLTLIGDVLNIQYEIASYYIIWCFRPNVAILSPVRQVLVSAFHKNLFALYSSFDLSCRGFYGPARSILRHALESLVIAKFCSVSDDRSVYDRWCNGEPIGFSNFVLNKIKHPDTRPKKEFWSLLSGYSHATIFAQQVSLNVETIRQEVLNNLVFLRMLLECNYHLLNRHLITPSMRYYSDAYGNTKKVPTLKKQLNALFMNSRRVLLKTPRTIIRNYKLTWKIQ